MTMVTVQTSKWKDWLFHTPAGNFAIAAALITLGGGALVASIATLGLQSFTGFAQMWAATGALGALLGCAAIATLAIGVIVGLVGGARLIRRARRGQTEAGWNDMAYVT